MNDFQTPTSFPIRTLGRIRVYICNKFEKFVFQVHLILI